MISPVELGILKRGLLNARRLENLCLIYHNNVTTEFAGNAREFRRPEPRRRSRGAEEMYGGYCVSKRTMFPRSWIQFIILRMGMPVQSEIFG
jgi:hypothetical protein